MAKRKLRNGGRDKASLGIVSGLIGAGGSIIGSLFGSSSAEEAARAQAEAMIESARIQAETARETNANNTRLQQQNIAFQKQMNQENRNIQLGAQLNQNLLGARENINSLRMNNRLQYKRGGNTRLRLRNGNNVPFKVTDGGGVIPLGVTPEGYNLFEIIGNDHNHYHKTPNGKNKTGVGFKFPNGRVIEGEGNQNSNIGELLLTTPDAGYFISKHTINGFNPAKAVKAGIHPLVAYNIQENNKEEDNSNMAKYGKRIRLRDGSRSKALFGDNLDYGNRVWTLSGNSMFRPASINNGNGIVVTPTNSSTGGLSRWMRNNGDIVGAGIGALGNIGGAIITSWGNNRAGNIISDANSQAASILSDAYRRMTGISPSAIDRRDFAAQHYMPVVRSPRETGNTELASLERSSARRRRLARRNSLSSAAIQSRLAGIESDRTEDVNKIMSEVSRRNEAINQANNQAINEANELNAKLDSQANQQYAASYIDLLKYNNDINNQKIAGEAEANANAIMNTGNTRAGIRQANATAFGNAITNSLSGLSNVLASRYKLRQDRNNIMLGATTDAQISDIAKNGTREEKLARLSAVDEALNSGRLSNEDRAKYMYYRTLLTNSL